MPERNPRASPLPPDAVQLLGDPRLDGLETEPLMYRTHPSRQLQPALSPTDEDPRYLKLATSYESDPGRNARWINAPAFYYMEAGGTGFPEWERPRFEQAQKAPKRLPHLWPWNRNTNMFIASPDMVELLRSVDAEAIETTPIDWVYSDAQQLDGYVLLDITRLHYAYDYARSVVDVAFVNGQRFAHLSSPRVLRAELPASLAIFRDATLRSDVLVTPALAREIASLAAKDIRFEGVVRGSTAEIKASRRRGDLRTRLKPAQTVYDESMPLGRKMALRVLPLMQEGRLAEAERILVEWLKARPSSPFQVIASLDITNSPAECARHFNAFASRVKNLQAIYAEMNGFTVNTDRWFFDACGFEEHGGNESYDWLGDFGECSADVEGSLTITGLEPVQALYAGREANRAKQTDEDTMYLVDTLVVVKFQRLLQRALPLMKAVKCPLLASAHDFDSLTVEIRAE
jgi:hypothetical protein